MDPLIPVNQPLVHKVQQDNLFGNFDHLETSHIGQVPDPDFALVVSSYAEVGLADARGSSHYGSVSIQLGHGQQQKREAVNFVHIGRIGVPESEYALSVDVIVEGMAAGRG